jgi:cytochrome c oxidase cbb3-type subunit 3
MFKILRRYPKYVLSIFAVMLFSFQPAHAGGSATISITNNPLTVIMIIVMVLLVIFIGILASILVGAADVKRRKRKQAKAAISAHVHLLILALFVPAGSLFAQDAPATTAVVTTIGGMSASTFYVMAVVIFLELAVILTMLINIRALIKTERGEIMLIADENAVESMKSRVSWWDRFNKLRPVSQESELDLGHEYDGIRELNNRLPPWWIYGFYLSIIFAGVYLWRFHVTHRGPSSKEEYEISVAKAEQKTKAYLAAKGEAVDENTVTLLTAPAELEEGKIIFMKSCASCHLESGGGSVGPNLTDDYWMHGNDIKSVFKTIRYGINAMPQWQNSYSNKQIAQVTSYIKSLRGTNPPNAKAPQGTQMKEVPVNNPPDSTLKKDGKVAMASETKQ